MNPEKKTKSQKAGLVLPFSLFQQKFEENACEESVTNEGAVYMTAVIEYIMAEVLELAGNACRDSRRLRIAPRDVQKAVREDEELNKLLGGLVVDVTTSSLPPKKKVEPPVDPKAPVVKVPTKAKAPAKVPVKSSTKKQAAKAPVKAPKAPVKAKAVKKLEIYFLFDAGQFANSDDAAHELGYAFHGAYISRKAALEAFATFMIESGNLMDKDASKFAKGNVENLLEQYGWKILNSEL